MKTINIILDAMHYDASQGNMNASGNFKGNRLITPIGRLVLLPPLVINYGGPALGGQMHNMGAFMEPVIQDTGAWMTESGLFTPNKSHAEIMHDTVNHLVETLGNSLKESEDDRFIVNGISMGMPTYPDMRVRFVPDGAHSVEFEKFDDDGWKVWDVTSKRWTTFFFDLNKEGVYTMITGEDVVIVLHLGLGDVHINIDEGGYVKEIIVPGVAKKFGVHASNEIFQYLKPLDV